MMRERRETGMMRLGGESGPLLASSSQKGEGRGERRVRVALRAALEEIRIRMLRTAEIAQTKGGRLGHGRSEPLDTSSLASENKDLTLDAVDQTYLRNCRGKYGTQARQQQLQVRESEGSSSRGGKPRCPCTSQESGSRNTCERGRQKIFCVRQSLERTIVGHCLLVVDVLKVEGMQQANKYLSLTNSIVVPCAASNTSH